MTGKTLADHSRAYRTRKAERIARMEAQLAELQEALNWAIAEIEARTRYSREYQFGNCLLKAKQALGDYAPQTLASSLPALHIES